MLAHELITENIPPLKLSDTGNKALKWMDEFKVAHLPLVEQGKYLGLISDADILDLNNPELTLAEQKNLEPDKIFVSDSQHVYDVIKLVHENHLTIIPVLNSDGNYLGAISLNNLLENIASISSISQDGSVLVLEVNYFDYSLAQIAQIVESNNARILSVFTHNHHENSTIDVTLKINKTDISSILQTFARYNIHIKSAFQIDNTYLDDLKTRYEALMNFLKL